MLVIIDHAVMEYRTMQIVHGGKLSRFSRISYVATVKVFQ